MRRTKPTEIELPAAELRQEFLIQELGITPQQHSHHGNTSALSETAQLRQRENATHVFRRMKELRDRLEEIIQQYIIYKRDQKLVSHAKTILEIGAPLRWFLSDGIPDNESDLDPLPDYCAEGCPLDIVTEETAWLTHYRTIMEDWCDRHIPKDDERYAKDRGKATRGVALLNNAIERRNEFLDKPVWERRQKRARLIPFSELVVKARMQRRFPWNIRKIQQWKYAASRKAAGYINGDDQAEFVKMLSGQTPPEERVWLERVPRKLKLTFMRWLHPQDGPEESPKDYE